MQFRFYWACWPIWLWWAVQAIEQVPHGRRPTNAHQDGEQGTGVSMLELDEVITPTSKPVAATVTANGNLIQQARPIMRTEKVIAHSKLVRQARPIIRSEKVDHYHHEPPNLFQEGMEQVQELPVVFKDVLESPADNIDTQRQAGDTVTVDDSVLLERAPLMRRSGGEQPASLTTLTNLLFGQATEDSVLSDTSLKVVVLSIIGIAFVFVLASLTKVDFIVAKKKDDGLAAEPSGSELQKSKAEPEDVCKKTAPGVSSLASMVEHSLPCVSSRKTEKDGAEESTAAEAGSPDDICHRIQALPVTTAEEVEEMMPSESGHDMAFAKPMSSRRLLRLDVKIEGPVDTSTSVTTPLTDTPCVLFSAHASRKMHGGMSMPVAFSSQNVDFWVSLCDAPSVKIQVSGSEVNLFASQTCLFSQVVPFPCAADRWQDFVCANLASAGAGGAISAAELRAKGTAIEFHESALPIGVVVTMVGELMRSANGNLTLQPLSSEQASFKRAGLPSGAPPDSVDLLEARSSVLASDHPKLLSDE
eukprot:gb/GFBE01036273.1/.p1 GENE.gb/GFBE01036273.1/~~gb/GFBE01036273.1/.p1  ORF type:complete len:531 (+),score=92.36 gb/GFBE01036273.1/:1-1593(+)